MSHSKCKKQSKTETVICYTSLQNAHYFANNIYSCYLWMQELNPFLTVFYFKSLAIGKVVEYAVPE